MERKQIGVSELYTLCNKEEFFTCGDVNQYQKMLDLASSGVTHMELTYFRTDTYIEVFTGFLDCAQGFVKLYNNSILVEAYGINIY